MVHHIHVLKAAPVRPQRVSDGIHRRCLPVCVYKDPSVGVQARSQVGEQFLFKQVMSVLFLLRREVGWLCDDDAQHAQVGHDGGDEAFLCVWILSRGLDLVVWYDGNQLADLGLSAEAQPGLDGVVELAVPVEDGKECVEGVEERSYLGADFVAGAK